MGRVALIILLVVFALACGALGWELLREKKEKESIEKRLKALEARPVSTTQPAVSEKTGILKQLSEDVSRIAERVNDLDRGYTALLEEMAKMRERLDGFGEKLSKAEEKGMIGAPSGFDPTKMTDEQREKFQREVARAMFKAFMSRATQFKDSVVKNFQQELKEKYAEKLDLAPMQVEDINAIIKDMADKGFRRIMELLQAGKMNELQKAGEELLDEFDEKVKQVLHPDQIEKWKEVDKNFRRREERRRRRKERQQF